MSAIHALLAYIVAARLAELALSARNTRRLRARGAVESGARHYPLFIALHGAWIVALALAVPADAPVNAPMLAVFVALQAGRVWVIATLGDRWTTRVIVPDGVEPVRTGPYRFLRHPNYAVVCGEIAAAPLIFGAWQIAVAFSLLNAALLAHRIGVENAALGRR